ncbi:hypothetical protein RHS03_06640, partial [Rhizoctonia solani]
MNTSLSTSEHHTPNALTSDLEVASRKAGIRPRPSRHRRSLSQVFPDGLWPNAPTGVNPRRTWRGSVPTYTPWKVQGLLDLLFETLPPHLVFINVTKTEYRKMRTGSQHEFIIVEVEDANVGVKNYMILDRTANPLARSSPTFISRTIIASSKVLAEDQVRVSYNGDKQQLLQDCGYGNCILLAENHFETTKEEDKLKLYELVAFACHASQDHPSYSLLKKNCYWFAGLINDYLKSRNPDGYKTYDDHKVQKGAYRIFKAIGLGIYYRTTTDEKEREKTAEFIMAEFEDYTINWLESRLENTRQYWEEELHAALNHRGYGLPTPGGIQ